MCEPQAVEQQWEEGGNKRERGGATKLGLMGTLLE